MLLKRQALVNASLSSPFPKRLSLLFLLAADSYLLHISKETASAVALKGRGSGSGMQETHEPLHLTIMGTNPKVPALMFFCSSVLFFCSSSP